MCLRPSLLLLLYTCGILALGAQSAGERRQLDRMVAENEVFGQGHTGFMLYDLAQDQPLYRYQADRYFVPASNVKLATFYLSQRILGRTAPAVHYRRGGDTLHLWGTGYPLLFHPSFVGYDTLGSWLRGQDGPLVLHQAAAERPPRYGQGWSWDDYDYGYVYERTALPVYGNRLYLDVMEGRGQEAGPLEVFGSPPNADRLLVQDANQRRTILRSETDNVFTLGAYFFNRDNFPLQRALYTSPELTLQHLMAGLPGQPVSGGQLPRPPLRELSVVTAPLPDTVFRRLLWDSDNFLAEQLILQAAVHRYGRFDEETLFDYARDTLLGSGLRLGRLRLVDGSGLSRYNLLTPAQLVQIVAALDREVGRDRLLSLLPAGGVSGTLRRRFDDAPEPYVWAKTGSLSGVLCISGLLRTQSGRWLAFSFLHNNVVAGTGAYYREMERVLDYVYRQW